jgi:hypothetical protein
MNPVTPPTIYVKRGCTVNVTVVDSSPLEDLTLDWKSSTVVIPPDTFQTAFNSISPNVGKLSDVVRIEAVQPTIKTNAEVADFTRCETVDENCDSAAEITAAQARVQTILRGFDPLAIASEALKSVKIALQPPPGGSAANAQPWLDTHTWKTTVATQLQFPVDSARPIGASVNLLASEIAKFEKANPSSGDKATLDKNQAALQTAYDGLALTVAKLAALEAAVNSIPDQSTGIIGNAVIRDESKGDKNYQTQTWTINFTNKLFPTAKRVAADTLKSENVALLSGLADPPAKVSLITITVQFQSPSRVEVSTGVMVPLTPYHGYVKASVAVNGVVTDNVVQENKTYTVVPMALINVLTKEWITGKQRSAFFVTGGVGFNPATNMVEFGAGVTYSYRSFAISGLIDIGRDTKLGGGFTVGQSLGPTSAAANPITSTYWTVKPAPAISVRIPLGGSGGK